MWSKFVRTVWSQDFKIACFSRMNTVERLNWFFLGGHGKIWVFIKISLSEELIDQLIAEFFCTFIAITFCKSDDLTLYLQLLNGWGTH